MILSARALMTAINATGVGNPGMMFKIFSLIYFLAFFVNMLYYLGVLQFIVLKLGISNNVIQYMLY